jgi:hypothetical protein
LTSPKELRPREGKGVGQGHTASDKLELMACPISSSLPLGRGDRRQYIFNSSLAELTKLSETNLISTMASLLGWGERGDWPDSFAFWVQSWGKNSGLLESR